VLLLRVTWAESSRLGPFRADLARDRFYFRNSLLFFVIL
jgi:hypothetical protein